jgi:coenzyme PQQ synthesis protein D (PqqD)
VIYETQPITASLLNARVSVPADVVFRSFPAETVVLNLSTGRYHGLNSTAGAILEALRNAATVHEAAVAVAVSYGQPLGTVERDVCDLCTLLLERGLIVLDEG